MIQVRQKCSTTIEDDVTVQQKGDEMWGTGERLFYLQKKELRWKRLFGHQDRNNEWY
jgi:hypothetical protein